MEESLNEKSIEESQRVDDVYSENEKKPDLETINNGIQALTSTADLELFTADKSVDCRIESVRSLNSDTSYLNSDLMKSYSDSSSDNNEKNRRNELKMFCTSYIKSDLLDGIKTEMIQEKQSNNILKQNIKNVSTKERFIDQNKIPNKFQNIEIIERNATNEDSEEINPLSQHFHLIPQSSGYQYKNYKFDYYPNCRNVEYKANSNFNVKNIGKILFLESNSSLHEDENTNTESVKHKISCADFYLSDEDDDYGSLSSETYQNQQYRNIKEEEIKSKETQTHSTILKNSIKINEEISREILKKGNMSKQNAKAEESESSSDTTVIKLPGKKLEQLCFQISDEMRRIDILSNGIYNKCKNHPRKITDSILIKTEQVENIVSEILRKICTKISYLDKAPKQSKVKIEKIRNGISEELDQIKILVDNILSVIHPKLNKKAKTFV